MNTVVWKKTQKIGYILYLLLASWLPVSRRSRLAKYLRNRMARMVSGKIDKTVNVEKGACFNPAISVRHDSSLGVRCELDGPISIGAYVMMGPDVAIYTRNHSHDRLDIPMCAQGFEEYQPVTIEDDCWIGRRAIILPGVTIKRGTIIGAGAVVTKDTEPFSIVGGVPAKQIGTRIKEN